MPEVVVGMPEMDAAGLSENWLFRHAGALHWRALCRGLGVTSDALRDGEGRRLYPTFVAVRARYGQPLNAVRENDRLAGDLALAHFGRAFVEGRARLDGPAGRIELTLLTTFAARTRATGNALHRSLPVHAYDRLPALASAPELLQVARRLRQGEADAHELAGHRIPLPQHAAGAAGPDAAPSGARETVYVPSPYVDYNGAGLLYFAAYPTIADTCERRLLTAAGTDASRHWALGVSTVARDVFYHANLDLDGRVVARLNGCARVADGYLLHTTLLDAADRRRLAEVFTLKAETAPAPEPPVADRAGHGGRQDSPSGGSATRQLVTAARRCTGPSSAPRRSQPSCVKNR